MNKIINEFNQIIQWPSKKSDKDFIIKWLSEKFIYNKKYSELEINKIINQYHLFDDVPLLRRELVSRKYLNRKDNGSIYWKNKP